MAFASADIPAPAHDEIGAHDGWLRTRPRGSRSLTAPAGFATPDGSYEMANLVLAFEPPRRHFVEAGLYVTGNRAGFEKCPWFAVGYF